MKHSSIYITIMVLCVFSDVYSAPISEDAARMKALSFLTDKTGNSEYAGAKGVSAAGGMVLTTAEACDAYYVFNKETDGGGYVVVSGDDRMPAVLGYSRSGRYDAAGVPANKRAWMQGYAEQYEYLQSNGVDATRINGIVTGDRILPLLKSQWSQSYPYNTLCPEKNGERTLTGCVATAMAQIMYYWQWPKQTTSDIPKYHGVPATSQTSIDWDNIYPQYSSSATEEQALPVSTLMKLCGASVKMNYGLNGSASSIYYATEAFSKYFDYDGTKISYVRRDYYNDTVWCQMMYDELKAGRPVIYDGQSSDGGHAFVIDGYDGDDYFHVNWGWGGYEDDYFLLNALNGYDYMQNAVIGIEGKEEADNRRFYMSLNNGTLTFYYDDKREERTGVLYNFSPAWPEEGYLSNAEEITAVVMDSTVADYHHIQSTSFWFCGMTNLSSIQGLQYLDTRNVTDMSYMFYNCSSLTTLDASNFDTQNVADMRMMFCNCKLLSSLDVSGFATNNVTDMNRMFFGCYVLDSLDVSNFDTGNVTDMAYMFCGCEAVSSLDVSGFDTENVTDMCYMFFGCKSLPQIDVSGFSTQGVSDMNCMFYGCNTVKMLDVSNFSTHNVTDMEYMFCYCYSLATLYAGAEWTVENVEQSSHMFSGCYSIKGEDGTIYDYQVTDKTKAHYGEGGYMTYKVATVEGDVNGDSSVTMSDANMVVNAFLNGEGLEGADMNGDGQITMSDANQIVNMFLNGK